MAISRENPWQKSVFLVRDILQKKKIQVDASDLAYVNGRHALVGVNFSDELKKDKDLLDHLKEIVEGFVRLFFFVEEDEALHLPADSLPEDVKNTLKGAEFTGINALLWFTTGDLSLEPIDEKTGIFELVVRPELLEKVENATAYFEHLCMRILSFNDTIAHPNISIVAPVYTISLEDSEEPKKEPDTDFLDDSFSPDYKEHIKNTLGEIHSLLSDLDESQTGFDDTLQLLSLTYEKGQTVDFQDYSIGIPDNFRIEKEGEEEVICYVENPENPDIWEASPLAFSLSVDQEDWISVNLLSAKSEQEKDTLKAFLENSINANTEKA